MIDRDHRLGIVRQCELLALPRSTFYYQPVATPPEALTLMRHIDALHLAHPWMGSRSIRDQRADIPISRDRLRRLMRTMDIHAIYRKPRTTIIEQAHKIYPYLLRELVIERPNQVWAADVTYIPMARGFLYLVVVMDWYSRKVLAWRLSNTLTADFCVVALRMPWRASGRPEPSTPIRAASSPAPHLLMRLTTPVSASAWTARAVGWTTCSSSGCGARSNMRRSTSEPTTPWPRLTPASDRYLDFYNTRRTHQALERLTPDEVYFQSHELRKAA
jgi:putative transposase